MAKIKFKRKSAVAAYPKGIWGSYGPNPTINPGLVGNLGIVGVGIAEDWAVVNPTHGVFNWSTVDTKVSQAKANGFKIQLIIVNSSDKTPSWLLDDSLPTNPERISLVDPSPSHPMTFCHPIPTCLYWDPVYKAARADLAAQIGLKYASDPDIVGLTVQFANQNSNDCNILDVIFTSDAPLECPMCGTEDPGQLCGPQVFDQQQEWLDAGFTQEKMSTAGKELMDAYAAAWPKHIKLPIGGMASPTLIPTYSAVARDMENFVYGNSGLGIPARPYASRFWMQRNTLNASWAAGTTYDTFVPGLDNDTYIRYMIRQHAIGPIPGHSGIQMVEQATNGTAHGCRLGGGVGGPCDDGVNECPDLCVMQTALDVARTFGTDFIEIFSDDAKNASFYSMISEATTLMGGTPRT